MLPLALCLLGPTASGKSAVAMELAQRHPLEIISVDSAQVYRDLDIGTAKPAAAERAACPHHLIDVVSPEEAYSAARFRSDALQAMADIHRRGRTPLLVGGTMLYYKALRDGLSALPPADPALRAQIEAQARVQGWPALHRRLATLDPVAAARLNPNDAQRIQRALEVVQLTGQALAASYARREFAPAPWRFVALALIPGQRAALHEAIARRFDAMLEAGLVDELRALRARYRLHGELPAMRCVGYRQTWEVLEGRLPMQELRDRGIFATRQLAKRQLTWLRGTPDLTCIDSQSGDRVNRALTIVADALDHGAAAAGEAV